MDRASFEEMLVTQDVHWWFKGKRKIIQMLIESSAGLQANEGSKILEMGCGTGGNLGLLSLYGKVTALELDDYAREHIVSIAGVRVLKGWLPDGMDAIRDESFDLICLFDVLEHIEDDYASLLTLNNYLKPGAKLLLTVPAYQWMFSTHDEKLGHYRRYNRKQLCDRLEKAGYKILHSGYMNMCLFPLMMLMRVLDKVRHAPAASGTKIPPMVINTLFYKLFSLESLWIPFFSTPFGGSVFALAQKTK